ncbi:MAG: hypothetical protein HRU20_14600 [Pseudomonadales bacterium]|nr:hypothetical protein [Pseudomonadales bacterium]
MSDFAHMADKIKAATINSKTTRRQVAQKRAKARQLRQQVKGELHPQAKYSDSDVVLARALMIVSKKANRDKMGMHSYFTFKEINAITGITIPYLRKLSADPKSRPNNHPSNAQLKEARTYINEGAAIYTKQDNDERKQADRLDRAADRQEQCMAGAYAPNTGSGPVDSILSSLFEETGIRIRTYEQYLEVLRTLQRTRPVTQERQVMNRVGQVLQRS